MKHKIIPRSRIWLKQNLKMCSISFGARRQENGIVDETGRTVRRLLLEAGRKVIHVMQQEEVLNNYCLKYHEQ